MSIPEQNIVLNNRKKLLKDIKNSSIATGIAEILTLPICTIKTNYQTTKNNSIINTAKDIYIKNGIKGFYNASVPAIIGQIISTTTKYTMYEYLKNNKVLEINNNEINLIKNGIISGVISTLLTHPCDIIRVSLQLNNNLVKEIKENGIKIFYRGYSKTLSKVILGSSLFFPLNDILKTKIENPILTSFTAGFISATILQPIDYMKTRHLAGKNPFVGSSIKNYYKGYNLNLLRIVPHFTITMTVMEYLKK